MDWPTYAHEIRTPAYGCGLEGLLSHRADRLVGILNGVDAATWDPHKDPHLVQPYSAEHMDDKAVNKAALQKQVGLPQRSDVPLIGFVGRLVWQKGVDLLLDALPKVLAHPAQCVVLGSGEKRLERAFTEAAARFPGKLAVTIGYNEPLAHRIEAGADMFVMPSRYEPCGLNQIYSLRYGTVPVVRRTGGLADTVVDAVHAGPDAATGFSFEEPSALALGGALARALALYAKSDAWRAMAVRGMRADFSWAASAAHYLGLYRRAHEERKRV